MSYPGGYDTPNRPTLLGLCLARKTVGAPWNRPSWPVPSGLGTNNPGRQTVSRQGRAGHRRQLAVTCRPPAKTTRNRAIPSSAESSEGTILSWRHNAVPARSISPGNNLSANRSTSCHHSTSCSAEFWNSTRRKAEHSRLDYLVRVDSTFLLDGS